LKRGRAIREVAAPRVRVRTIVAPRTLDLPTIVDMQRNSGAS